MFLLQEDPNVKQMEEFFQDWTKPRAKEKHNDQQRGGEDRQNKTIRM